MRYVAAYLLAVLGGKASPAAADLEKILSSVGIEADAEKLKKVIGELSGKNVEELMAQGRDKLASMPAGGAAAPAAAPQPLDETEGEKAEESDVDRSFDEILKIFSRGDKF